MSPLQKCHGIRYEQDNRAGWDTVAIWGDADKRFLCSFHAGDLEARNPAECGMCYALWLESLGGKLWRGLLLRAKGKPALRVWAHDWVFTCFRVRQQNT